MGESKAEILAKQQGVVRGHIRIGQQARDPCHILVRKELSGLLSQETGGDEHIELLAPIEIEHVTNPVEYFPADPAAA